MKHFAVSVLVVLVMGCDPQANPRSCIDGVCSDPEYPFCDVDGTFGGVEKECINAGCPPGEFERCVGASAYRCNAFGNSFGVETCAYGCDDSLAGCRTCATNSDCTPNAPVCDQSMNACRSCAADSECDSRVCDHGSCVDAATILYAAPDGASSATCSQNDPCAASTAVMKAIVSVDPRTIHLASGLYASLTIPSAATQLTLVGEGATLSGDGGGLRVDAAARVVGRGLEITGVNDVLVCGSAGGALAKVSLSDSILLQPDTSRVVSAISCEVSLSATELRTADVGSPSSQATIALGTDGTLVGDRIHVHGLRTTVISMMGQRMTVRITNSLLENTWFLDLSTDSGIPGSSALFAWNTFVSRNSNTALDCSSTTLRLANNIIFGTAVSNVLSGNACVTQTNVLMPQSPLPSGNIGSDPQFQDVSAGNFRLKASSPAVGTAAAKPPSDHDFAGVARPQGGAPDIGAYEQ